MRRHEQQLAIGEAHDPPAAVEPLFQPHSKIKRLNVFASLRLFVCTHNGKSKNGRRKVKSGPNESPAICGKSVCSRPEL